MANGATPVRRGPIDEDADFEAVVQKMMIQDFDDWPNEAGFQGLTEVRGPVELMVKGHIPAYAAGTLYRTGPGEYDLENTPKGTFRTTHWFDGFGHTHKFDIIPDASDARKPMRVEYSSKRQSQDLVEIIKKTGHRQQNISFGQRRDPCIGLFGKIMTVWRNPSVKRTANPDNISVTVQANVPGLPSCSASVAPAEAGHRSGLRNVWLTTDSNSLKKFDQQTLEPIGHATQETLHPLLKGPLSCAHAQRDPDTGDLFNYNLEMGRYATYRVFRVNASDGTTDILATICEADVMPAYIHSFFLSTSFVILCVPSSHIGMMGLKVVWERNLVDAIDPFDASKRCKWFVIDRVGSRGVVATFESDAGFFFHSINAFEVPAEVNRDINVFCDMIQYKNLDVIRSFEMDILLQRNNETKRYWGDETRNRNLHARLVRYRLCVPGRNLGSQRPSNALAPGILRKVFEIKTPHVGELPTINPRFATRKHRYVYSLPNRGHSTLLDSLVKTDLQTHERLFWDNPQGHTPGEAIFVPRPRGAGYGGGYTEFDEDDGVLLSVVLDGFGKTSYLLCLDAKTMTELGRAECEWAIALGFHGLHTSAVVPS